MVLATCQELLPDGALAGSRTTTPPSHPRDVVHGIKLSITDFSCHVKIMNIFTTAVSTMADKFVLFGTDGWNNNPTAKQFQHTYKRLTCHHLNTGPTLPWKNAKINLSQKPWLVHTVIHCQNTWFLDYKVWATVKQLMGDAWLKAATPSNIMSGFKTSGIWPIDRHVFSADHFCCQLLQTDLIQSHQYAYNVSTSCGWNWNIHQPSTVQKVSKGRLLCYLA